MDQLEQMISESLETRAHDVEPTPALWEQVEGRIRRRRWLTAGGVALGAAAAVLAGVVVVPGLVGSPAQPDIADQPPATAPATGSALPTAEETTGGADGAAVPSTIPGHYVAVEQRLRVTLRETATDEVVAVLREEVTSPELESVIDAVAVRPGSTVDDLTVAVSRLGEGYRWIELWQVVGGERQQTESWTSPGSTLLMPPMTLAWSPDGSHLAWTPEAGLRVAPFEELVTPPTETVEGLERARAGTVVAPEAAGWRVVDWAWESTTPEGAASGRIALTDGSAPSTVSVARDASGEVRVESVDGEPDGPTFGRASSNVPDVDADGAYALRAVDGSLELEWQPDDGSAPSPLDLGGDLTPTEETWLRAHAGGVLVGKSDGVWLVPGDGASRRLPEVVGFAAFLPEG